MNLRCKGNVFVHYFLCSNLFSYWILRNINKIVAVLSYMNVVLLHISQKKLNFADETMLQEGGQMKCFPKY